MYGVKEIADHFGRCPVTISEGIKRVGDLQARDKSFAKKLSFASPWGRSLVI